MGESSLFSLPPEMLCGLCSYLPGEDLREFGSTCRRLKSIADKTAIGRIAYLLRKSDPLWARLHKGAVRQGLRSASAILAWMEGNRKNQDFGQKSKFWAKIKIFGKNQNFGQKLKILGKNQNFGQKSKFWAIIEILGNNRNFGQKSKFWAKIENFGQKSKFWAKIKILGNNRNFGQ